MAEDYVAQYTRIMAAGEKRFASDQLVHREIVGAIGSGMGFQVSTPGRAWVEDIQSLVQAVLHQAKEAGISSQEVVRRLKSGEPIDGILPGIGDLFPGRTSAYLIWELQAATGGRRD